MINIFDYTDYRKYLSDFFVDKKKESRFFSHRYLCGKLGLKSSNFMLMVMKGKRNISTETCSALAKILKLNERESVYFINMVFFSQAKNYTEKNEFWEKMINLRRKTKFGRIDESQYEYYSNWYNVAIRELVVRMDLPLNYTVLANLITPPITAPEARKGVALLTRLGIIRKTETGYVKTERTIKTDDQVTSLAVFNYHLKMNTIAAFALQNNPRESRNFSACTIDISQNCYDRVVAAINELRDEIMSICEKEENPERVYHLNLQLFPITENYQKTKGKKAL